MKRKISFHVSILIIGLCCIAASFFFTSNEVKSLSGLFIGAGAGLVGMSISNIVLTRLVLKNPELEQQAVIDMNDERNTFIQYRAKARAGDITQWFIIGTAILSILLSAPLAATLSVIAVFLLYNILGFCLTAKYQKEM